MSKHLSSKLPLSGPSACPVVKAGPSRIGGCSSLENNLRRNVFTPARISVTRIAGVRKRRFSLEETPVLYNEPSGNGKARIRRLVRL